MINQVHSKGAGDGEQDLVLPTATALQQGVKVPSTAEPLGWGGAARAEG